MMKKKRMIIYWTRPYYDDTWINDEKGPGPEDPNMIRDGFRNKSLDNRLCLNAGRDKIEVHNLYVTDDIDREQNREHMIPFFAQVSATVT